MSEPIASGAALLTVALPLAAAPLPFLLRGRGARALAAVTVFGVALALTAIAFELSERGPQLYRLGAHAAPLGIGLRIDGLALLLLAVTTGIMAAVCLHAGRSLASESESETGDGDRLEPARQAAPFWSLLLFLWAALDALYLSNDLFNLYVGLELLGLASVGLVAVGGSREALAASMRYLLISLVGSLVYLLGVAFLYAEHGSLALDLVGASIHARLQTTGLASAPGAAVEAALVFMSLGLALKTALVPFHGWLPRAHASAPSAVSALLSAVVVKASFYVLLRLWIEVFWSVLEVPLVQGVGLLGAVAIVWGALVAIRQERLKLVVAFSTVSQLGYLFVLLPVALAAAPFSEFTSELTAEPARVSGVVPLGRDAVARTAWLGGALHLAAHAAAKASLFLAAGNVLWCLGHDRVAGLAGLARRAPGTVLALVLAGVSLVGLPPSGGFLAKWLLVTAAIERGQWAWALAMLAGSILTAIYIFGIVGATLREEGDEEEGELEGTGRLDAEAQDERGDRARRFRPVPATMTVAALALAFVAIGLGVWPAGVLALLEQSRGFPW